uniref:Uncharacterized protein n=1 Tax=Anguilla anguilla TaxID=7936 RepID=A0A0E9Q9Q4_ANGAN
MQIAYNKSTSREIQSVISFVDGRCCF